MHDTTKYPIPKGAVVGPRVLLQLIDEDYKGRLVIPDTGKDAPKKGIVLILGDPDKNLEHHPEVGNMVTFSKYSGSELTIDDVKYLILRQDEVLFIHG